LNAIIQPFQQEERVVGFFNTYRQLYPVTRDVLREIATQFHNWVKNQSQKWGAPVLDDPGVRRDKLMDSYFRQARADQVVCILKAREPGRILSRLGQQEGQPLASGTQATEHYNFYINDSDWGAGCVRAHSRDALWLRCIFCRRWIFVGRRFTVETRRTCSGRY
jgi:hypothetical protein